MVASFEHLVSTILLAHSMMFRYCLLYHQQTKSVNDIDGGLLVSFLFRCSMDYPARERDAWVGWKLLLTWHLNKGGHYQYRYPTNSRQCRSVPSMAIGAYYNRFFYFSSFSFHYSYRVGRVNRSQ